jgi:ribosomal protein L29
MENKMKVLLMSEIREKTHDELKSLIEDYSKELFKFRMKKNSEENQKHHMSKLFKKNIARIKTYLAEVDSK